jgi:cobalt/nickel transport system permease protein
VVEKTAFMPDYGFKAADTDADEGSALGTSAAGLVGSLITVLLAAGIGLVIHLSRRAGQRKRASV